MPGRVVRVPDLKSGDPDFKSRSDNLLVLSQVDPALSLGCACPLVSWDSKPG